jgi:molybdopterin-guanine dinucleotide biosynthesis protein A
MQTASRGQVAAIVLAGGAGSRLGGVDKAAIDVAGRTLLDRALAAVTAADITVVVGPPRDLPASVLGTQEQPPGGGPVAAVAAGLSMLSDHGDDNGLVVVLACDMPFLDAAAVGRLVSTAHEHSDQDGAAYVDENGRRQYLAAAYDISRLRSAIGSLDEVDGAAMRHVVERLTIVEIAADPEITLDCDTWPDVRRSHELGDQGVEER